MMDILYQVGLVAIGGGIGALCDRYVMAKNIQKERAAKAREASVKAKSTRKERAEKKAFERKLAATPKQDEGLTQHMESALRQQDTLNGRAPWAEQ